MVKYLIMKNIFKVHIFTYFILLSAFLCGLFNYVVIIMTILLFHDLGHIIMMMIYKIKIRQILVLPFGSIIYSNIKYNIKSSQLFMVSIMGIVMQVLLDIIFYILFNYGFINDISYHIFLRFNKLIILFNLMPISILDGSKILQSIMEKLFSYKLSLVINNIIGSIFIVVFLHINEMTLSLVLIVIILLYNSLYNIFNLSNIYYKFLIERFLYPKNFFKIKYVNSINKIRKNRLNFINNVPENKILKNLFS